MNEMKEQMYTIELIKCDCDGSITCSEVVDAYEDDEQALNYVWDQVSSWYNKDWDYVLVNDPGGCCIFSAEPDYNHDGSARYVWLDHYDWVTDIYNKLVRPFEPVGGNKKACQSKRI